MRKTFFSVTIILALVSCNKGVQSDCIRSAGPWLDTEGKKIEAHGFQIFYDDATETYYWYGENKEHTKVGSNVWTWGIRCYASKDFRHWEDKGLIIPPDTVDVHSPLHYSQQNDRPHIIYNARTQKYVCWIKNMSSTVFFVMQADNILGPYEMVNRGLRPQGFGVGDFDLWVNDATGKAYIWFERPHWEMICCELNDSYTDVTDLYSEHFVGLKPPYTREAPTHFMHEGRHYLFTSGTTSYFANPSLVSTFDDIHGFYTDLGNPHPSDTTNSSFCSQITDVVKIHGKKDLYVAVADRWFPRYAGVRMYEQMQALFADSFKDFVTPERNFDGIGEYPDWTSYIRNEYEDVEDATYVFLPIRFVEGMPVIDWKDEWRLEDYQ